MNFELIVTWFHNKFCMLTTLSSFSLLRSVLPRGTIILMTEWICRWKPFWFPTVDTFQKAYLEEWQLVDDRSIPWKEL